MTHDDEARFALDPTASDILAPIKRIKVVRWHRGWGFGTTQKLPIEIGNSLQHAPQAEVLSGSSAKKWVVYVALVEIFAENTIFWLF